MAKLISAFKVCGIPTLAKFVLQGIRESHEKLMAESSVVPVSICAPPPKFIHVILLCPSSLLKGTQCSFCVAESWGSSYSWAIASKKVVRFVITATFCSKRW